MFESKSTCTYLIYLKDDLPEVNDLWNRCLASGEPYNVEYRCQRHDGIYEWMLGSALPLRDPETNEIIKWIGSCTVVEEQVQARALARKTKEQLQNVMSHAAITLWQVDAKKRLTLLEGRSLLPGGSKNARQMNKAIVGKQIEEAFPNQLEFTSPIDRVLNGEKEAFSETLIFDRFYRTSYIPILGETLGAKNDSGSEHSIRATIYGVIGVSMDITDTKNQEYELAAKAEENLRLMAQESAAKEASRLKSQFLANMSHEVCSIFHP